MISLKSIIRLADRHQQVVIDQFRIECVQDGSVMKQKSALALLGIAGDFSARQAQIARAGQLKPEVSRSGLPGGRDVGESVAYLTEDESE